MAFLKGSSSIPSRPSGLTAAHFDALLAWLAPAAEPAAQAYEMLRRKLILFFRVEARHWADELADETLNRIARRVAEGEVIRGTPTAYARGVANNVLHEYRRAAQRQRPDEHSDARLAELVAAARDPEQAYLQKERAARQQACLQQCLRRHTQDERDLLRLYHHDDPRQQARQRAGLAAQAGLTDGSLRSRYSRLRQVVRECVQRCLAAAK